MGRGKGRVGLGVSEPVGRYTVVFARSTLKALGKIQGRERLRIRAAIELLAGDPRPRSATALSGSPRGRLRIRVGDDRIVYTIEDDALRVLVVAIGYRGEIYER